MVLVLSTVEVEDAGKVAAEDDSCETVVSPIVGGSELFGSGRLAFRVSVEPRLAPGPGGSSTVCLDFLVGAIPKRALSKLGGL